MLQPAEVAGRRALRRPGAGLQELRRAAPRRPRDRRHALHQHPQRPPQQHQAGRRAHGTRTTVSSRLHCSCSVSAFFTFSSEPFFSISGPGNGDRPGRGQRQQPERVDGERQQQEEGVPNDLRPLLLGHEGAWVVRVVQGGHERGRRDGQEGDDAGLSAFFFLSVRARWFPDGFGTLPARVSLSCTTT